MRALKTTLFHALSSFRSLMRVISWVFMFLFLFGFCASWLLAPGTDAAHVRWLFFALGIMFWAFCWFYGDLLFKLTPGGDRETPL